MHPNVGIKGKDKMFSWSTSYGCSTAFNFFQSNLRVKGWQNWFCGIIAELIEVFAKQFWSVRRSLLGYAILNNLSRNYDSGIRLYDLRFPMPIMRTPFLYLQFWISHQLRQCGFMIPTLINPISLL